MRVLIVEDDPDISGLVVEALKRDGAVVDAFAEGGDGLHAARSAPYDTIVVDRRLPDMDGVELVRRLRAEGNGVPILILTARRAVADRVEGLQAGADDYLTKPFAVAELKARIAALARRPRAMSENRLTLGNVSYDVTARDVRVGQQSLPLSRRELDLLELLMRRARTVMPKSAIEERLYGLGEALGSNTVEVHVHNLRRALERVGASVQIETRRGIGYLLTEKPAA
jgi:DNA-binding response OmpR family regulator